MKVSLVEKLKADHKVTPVLFVAEQGVRTLVREKGIESLELSIPKILNRRTITTLIRSIVVLAKQYKKKHICIDLTAAPFSSLHIGEAELTQLASENVVLANFDFTTFKTKPTDGFPSVDEVTFIQRKTKATEAALQKGKVIGEEVNKTRELSNTPGGDMTPKGLAQAAKRAAKGLPITVSTLTTAQM
jgi:leucyl aminopeptidase